MSLVRLTIVAISALTVRRAETTVELGSVESYALGGLLKHMIGLYEVMVMTPGLRKLVMQNVGAAEIRDAAIDEGSHEVRGHRRVHDD